MLFLDQILQLFFLCFWLTSLLFMFKEAYEEFKHVLLAFIYDKDNQTSPVTYEVDNTILSHIAFLNITFGILETL